MRNFARAPIRLLAAGLGVLVLSIGACSPLDDSTESVGGALSANTVTVAGVEVELDPNLPQALARPEMLPLIASHEASLDELIEEGRKIWLVGNPLRGQPFSIPEAL